MFIIVVLMSLTTNCISCATTGSVCINWLSFLYCNIFFCFFACQVNFYQILDIVNFMVLSCGTFFIPLNILDLHSGMQLSFLESVLVFQALLLSLVKWGQISGQSRDNLSSLLRHYSMPHALRGFSSLDGGNANYSQH